MGQIRGIVFDKDGTLFDFQATWGAWSRTILDTESRGDATLRAALADRLGFDEVTGTFRPGSLIIGHTTEEVARAVLPLFPGESLAALMARFDARAIEAPQVTAAPLPALMAELRGRGLRLGVATNDTEGPARAHLAQAGVLGSFDFVAGFNSGWGGKPAPGQLLAFAETTGLPPAACAMVGDSLHDMHAGRAAGMVCVAVLTGPARHDDLAPAADVVLSSIAALPDWLDSRG